MRKAATTNTFTGGLVQDLNPLNNLSKMNDVLTYCLNGTLITYNGNEYVLQNDMGNGRVETATLPEGFIPLGTAELGGIIYIVSYNPLTNQSQIGSFPSPERNITTDELGEPNVALSHSDFFKQEEGRWYIKGPKYKLNLLNKEINPGDKFQIYSPNLDTYSRFLSAWAQSKEDADIDKSPKYLKLHVVSVDKEGKITFLDNGLVWQPLVSTSGYYYICDKDISVKDDGKTPNVLEYRDLVNSNYNVFTSKSKGTLAILAELECIDTFNVGWDANIKDEGENKKAEIFLTLNWTYENSNKESRNKINLNKLLVTDNSKETSVKVTYRDNTAPEINFVYPEVKDSDILKNNPYKPFYNCINKLDSNGNIQTSEAGEKKPENLRKNDGTDNDLIIGLADAKYSSKIDEEQKVTFNIVPGMPFGYMDYLEKSITIDFNKLGTGATDLVEWRYYVNSDNTVINWGLDCYPEKNKKVNSVRFDFYEFNKDMNHISNKIDSKCFKTEKNKTLSAQIKCSNVIDKDSSWYIEVNNKSSYSGHFTETLPLSEDTKNKCYLTKITIDYNGEKRYYFRFLYTATIFNNRYLSSLTDGTLDFADIVLDDVLKFNIVADTPSSTWSVDKNSDGFRITPTYHTNDGEEFDFSEIYLTPKQFSNAYQSNNLHLNYNFIVKGQTNNSDWDKLFKINPFPQNDVEYKVTPQYNSQIKYTENIDELSPISVCGHTKNDEEELITRCSVINHTGNPKTPIAEMRFDLDVPVKTFFNAYYQIQKQYPIEYTFTKLKKGNVNIAIEMVRRNQGVFGKFEDGSFAFISGDKGNIEISVLSSNPILNKIGDYDIAITDWKLKYARNGAVKMSNTHNNYYPIWSEEGDVTNVGTVLTTLTIRNSSGSSCIPVADRAGLRNTILVNKMEYLNKWQYMPNQKENIYPLSNLCYYESYNLSLLFECDKHTIEFNTFKIGDAEVALKGDQTSEEWELPANITLLKQGKFKGKFESSKYKIDTSALLGLLNSDYGILGKMRSKIIQVMDPTKLFLEKLDNNNHSFNPPQYEEYKFGQNNYQILDNHLVVTNYSETKHGYEFSSEGGQQSVRFVNFSTD